MNAAAKAKFCLLVTEILCARRIFFDALRKEGFHVLAIAWRRVALDYPHAVVDDETELTFSGFAAFLDPPKVDGAESLKELARSDVAVKVLTESIATQVLVIIVIRTRRNPLQSRAHPWFLASSR